MSNSNRQTSKPYDPHEVEEKIYKTWERAKAFSPAAKAKRGQKSFSIVIPPPNVTGSLHMGHALNASMQDALIRFHRMKGDDTVWIPGTDHAGIATQNVVEKQLKKEGLSRHDLGREKFIERVWEWKNQYGKTIGLQIRRLGSSCDWTRERFTMDPGYVRAVQEAFIHYANKGLIYRGNRIVNWCPRCASSISDLEVKYEEQNGLIYNVSYLLSDGSGEVVVATTRPETMLGDSGVAVYPGDERYKHLIGKKLRLPLVGREIPIVADHAVEKDFGTGAVKVTPAHDLVDWEIGARQKLEVINVIGEDGKMTGFAGDKYEGLSVEDARKKVVEDLKKEGRLQGEPVQMRHNIALCDRCGTVIQPLVSKQWFVKMQPLAAPAKKAGEDNLITFHPERWRRAYLEWLNGVKDWCISRQLWWGHRIPVWYCEADKSHSVFSIAKPKKCPECDNKNFVQDPDVLDTWFSSALWPFAVFGWPEATDDFARFYPTSVLATARDILALWVARMVFSGLEFTDRKKFLPAKQYGKTNAKQQVPFKDVIIHPTVLNLKGQRMSKSLGTGIDPIDLIEQYGADATRFGLLVQTQQDQQALRFDENAVRTGRNFVNKLWNIAKYLKTERKKGSRSSSQTPFDQWVQQRVEETTREVTSALEELRFGDGIRTLHSFVWDDFADWYIEASKVDGTVNTKNAVQVFQRILVLAHPFLPFITEELWKEFGTKDLLIVSAWPKTKKAVQKNDGNVIELVKQTVKELRSLRGLLGVLPAERLALRLGVEKELDGLHPVVEKMANVSVVTEQQGDWIIVPTALKFSVALEKTLLRKLPLKEKMSVMQKDLEKAKDAAAKLKQRILLMQGKAPEEVVADQREQLALIEGELRQKTGGVEELRKLLTFIE